jgi:hypothetical protein
MSLVKDDFTGNNPFWKWMLAILLIGATGYVPNLRPISRGFMALVIVVFLLSNEGVFEQLQKVFTNTTSSTSSNSTSNTASNSTSDESLNTEQTSQLMNALDILSKTSGQ